MTGVLEREVLCVHLFLICMCKAECFELPIVIRKVPYNTLTARYPRECLCLCLCNLKGQHSLAALSYPFRLHAF